MVDAQSVQMKVCIDSEQHRKHSELNRSGLAYHDTAAQAANFQLDINRGMQSVFGTNAATPTVDSVIQLINSDRHVQW